MKLIKPLLLVILFLSCGTKKVVETQNLKTSFTNRSQARTSNSENADYLSIIEKYGNLANEAELKLFNNLVEADVDNVKQNDFKAYKLDTEKKLLYLQSQIDILNNPDVVDPPTPSNNVIYGFGSGTTGGEGQTPYVVSNLNLSGEGSFTDAISQSNRLITFSVSGWIKLDPLKRYEVGCVSNITVDGSTAPNGGVGFRDGGFRSRASNIIYRNIRFMLGDNGHKDANDNIVGLNYLDFDTMNISSGLCSINNVVFDHCDFGWSIDELIDIYGYEGGFNTITNLTFQDCLVAEPLSRSHHNEGAHPFGVLVGGTNPNNKPTVSGVTFYRNLFVSMRERIPSFQGGVQGQFINNVAYNFNIGSEIEYGVVADYIGNHYKLGFNMGEFPAGKNCIDIYGAGAGKQPIKDTRVYISGNTNDYGMGEYDSVLQPYKESTPIHPLNGIVPTSSAESVNYVLNNAGAMLPKPSSWNLRIKQQYKDNTARMINSPKEVGGYPKLNE